ncbi:MAG: hypothetical protein ACKO91_13450 [Acidimicrobiales bacterium]
MASEQQNIQALMARVRTLEEQVRVLAEATGVAIPPLPEDPVQSALRQGNVLAAVTAYQQQTGASLGESKAAVEALKARLGL